MMTREEHLNWCKDRALRYVDVHDDLDQAVASMRSDLSKHSETRELLSDPYRILLGMQHVLNCDAPGVRKWIEGFR